MSKKLQPQFTSSGYLKLKNTVFQPISPYSPGFFPPDTLSGNQVLINYRSNHVYSISLYEFLSRYENQQLPATFLKDKIILIGATHSQFDNNYDDKWMTPYPYTQDNNRNTPGVLIQAQMISQILGTVTSDRALLSFL
ncbi:MAG: CHASE2 domain-containing protein, partial [Calothrix sp. SM1_7_51]|nr:CHASE2 domain-containing protein [Calothrix sp. SM1_7_51]